MKKLKTHMAHKNKDYINITLCGTWVEDHIKLTVDKRRITCIKCKATLNNDRNTWWGDKEENY